MSVVFDAKTGRLRDDGAAEQAEAPAEKERGHGRGKTQRADKTDIGLRGVPVIGHGSGAISDTSPGGELGAAARLERAGRELVRAHRNRFKAAHRPPTVGGSRDLLAALDASLEPIRRRQREDDRGDIR